MKKIKIFCLVVVAGLAFSCKKDDINGDASRLIEGSYIKLDSTITTNLDFSISTASVGIFVTQWGSPVKSIDIYVAKGSNAEDTTGWVKIKTVTYSDKVLLSVTTAELANALAPDAIAPGTVYPLRNIVNTVDGRRYGSFNTPETYSSFPAYKMAIKWQATAVCPYTNNAAMAGDYTVVSDPNWQDWPNNGGPVKILAGAKANELDLENVWPNPKYGTTYGPWYVDIDPATGAATVPKSQKIGNYGSYDLTVDSSPGSGFVFSCTGVITLTIPLYATGYGPQGSAKITLKKI